MKKDGLHIDNIRHDLLFPKNIEELGQKFFTDKKVSQDHLARYLFQESCQHTRTARISGKMGVSNNRL